MDIPVAQSSGEKEASTVCFSAKCALTSVLVLTDGTNAAVAIVYDSATATTSGKKKIAEFTVAGSDNYGGRNWAFPVDLAEGLYITVSGTGASFIAEYIPG